jgi:hypothetical protein
MSPAISGKTFGWPIPHIAELMRVARSQIPRSRFGRQAPAHDAKQGPAYLKVSAAFPAKSEAG